MIVFVIVPLVNLGRMDLFMPKIEDDGNVVRPSHYWTEIRETAWIKYASELLAKEEIDNNVMTTWSGYDSRMKDWSSLKPRAKIGILPLFPDKSLQFPSPLGDVQYVILYVQTSYWGYNWYIPWLRMGSGWCLRPGCSPGAELYHRWITIKRALGKIINFYWWPSISFSKDHYRPFPQSHRVIPTHLKNDLTSSRGRDVCSSTVHLSSSLKFSFGVCALSGRWWFWALCLGWIILCPWFLAFDHTIFFR